MIDMIQEQEIFSRIPMRTWRWLGVNEARVPENVHTEPKKQQILVEKDSEDALILTHRESGSYEVQVHLAENAKLDLVLAQLVPDDKPYTCRVNVRVEDGAKFSYTVVEAGAREMASEVYVDLAGREAAADVWGLYFGDGEEKLDLNYIIRQSGRLTDANMQVRGVLMGKAEKTFRGTLDFIEGSKGSVGREDEEVVLLSPDVRNRSVPVMLSHEADVDGHHAVSVGKMDEGKLFYLMSRGLDLAEAQRLVVEASFNPVLDRISDTALKEEIDSFLMGRLNENG